MPKSTPSRAEQIAERLEEDVVYSVAEILEIINPELGISRGSVQQVITKSRLFRRIGWGKYILSESKQDKTIDTVEELSGLYLQVREIAQSREMSFRDLMIQILKEWLNAAS